MGGRHGAVVGTGSTTMCLTGKIYTVTEYVQRLSVVCPLVISIEMISIFWKVVDGKMIFKNFPHIILYIF